MRAKFVGGPLHGSMRDITHPERPLQVAAKQTLPASFYADFPLAPIPFDTETYEMRMVTVTINGQTYRAPAMHPDGSIFMVHQNYKRGKK